jgi:hypothetical protein
MSNGSGSPARVESGALRQQATAVCTIADLLSDPALQMRTRVPGDPARAVTRVHPTELADPSPYLRPAELVCTAGAALTTEEACRRFVATVRGSGAAGICFGLGDFHDQPPPALVAACRQHNVCLLTLPQGVPFVSVADLVDATRAVNTDAARVGQLLAQVGQQTAPPESLRPWLAALGLSEDRLTVAVWPEARAVRLAPLLRTAVLGDTPWGAVAVAHEATAMADTVAATGLRCGYSSTVALSSLASGILAASSAAVCTGPGTLAGPERLTTLEGLIVQLPTGTLRHFAALLDQLEKVGAAHTPSYLETLRVFLQCDLSVSRTANRQFLHPNTVRHRLALIRQTTGRDPVMLADALVLGIALAAKQHLDGGA